MLCLLQRSDDDDRGSDRKDGALEEQIERLQEKVESAQSEQKNLFLVIFQVPWRKSKCYVSFKISLITKYIIYISFKIQKFIKTKYSSLDHQHVSRVLCYQFVLWHEVFLHAVKAARGCFSWTLASCLMIIPC